MPRPGLRTHRFKRIAKKVGGTLVVHYMKRKPAKARCGSCGRPLSGVARDIPSRLRKLPKSKKKPNRAYGGNLCPKCSREAVRAKALKASK